MTQTFTICGITYNTPEIPENGGVDGYKYNTENQIFRHIELPDFMGKTERNKDRFVWTEQQRSFMTREYNRCKEDGYWVYINGAKTYITPIHYFYLNYYTLEDGGKPDYRDKDRIWFYFLDYCLKRGFIKGIVRLKQRREGATSQCCAWLLWTALFFTNSKCGLVSKTETDAEAAYNTMIEMAWNNLHPFLQPEHNRHTSKRIEIKKQSRDGNTGGDFVINDTGMNCSISYRSTTLTAFDSTRLTAGLFDESSKWEKVNILQYISKVSETMMIGARRVGFMILPTSMNQMNKGGNNFITLYRSSDQTTSENGRTTSGLYKFFMPAYHGMEGFIGKYGESIIDAPDAGQLKYLKDNYNEMFDMTIEDLSLGAKEYIRRRKSEIKDPTILSEYQRSHPISEDEVLTEANSGCYFNSDDILSRILFLNENPPVIRTGQLINLTGNKPVPDVHFRDDSSGNWHFLKFPPAEEQNVSAFHMGFESPVLFNKIKIGVDPFRNSIRSFGSKGSNGTIVVMSAIDTSNIDNTGEVLAFYRGRPSLKSTFYDEVIKACRFFSAKVNIESDIDDFYEYFLNRKLLAYCRHTPASVIDPQTKGVELEHKRNMFGTKSSDPFAMNKELELLQMYLSMYIEKVYFVEMLQDALHYDHANRTKSDLTIAWMMALADMASFSRPSPTLDELNIQIPIKSYNIFQRKNY